MQNSRKLYDRMKEQYDNFVIENIEVNSAVRYIAELNFVKKLLEIALQTELDDEVIELNNKKEEIIQNLAKFGVKPKNI